MVWHGCRGVPIRTGGDIVEADLAFAVRQTAVDQRCGRPFRRDTAVWWVVSTLPGVGSVSVMTVGGVSVFLLCFSDMAYPFMSWDS
jgi:hypothetical protein